jgi:hypothetical protein
MCENCVLMLVPYREPYVSTILIIYLFSDGFYSASTVILTIAAKCCMDIAARQHGCRVFKTFLTLFLSLENGLCCAWFIYDVNYRLNRKLQTRPLVREGTPYIKDRKFQTATFRQEIISGHKSHKGNRYQDILTD